MRLFNGFFRANVAKTLFYTTPGNYSLTLGPGKYEFITRAGGGAGGENRMNDYTVSENTGGAGGKGQIMRTESSFTELKVITLTVGSGGLTKSNGGNGGNSAYPTGTVATKSGAGGGGGHASFLSINGTLSCWANGGGGGGGAGSGGTFVSDGVYHNAQGIGGGGGGYYAFSNGTETNYAGKNGAASQTNGVAGNQTFSSIYSGDGVGTNFGHKAYGGGASGGGGGYFERIGPSTFGRGGDGAGGDYDAGGGAGSGAGIGYNPHSTPTDTTSENATYGVTGAYGRGGGSDTNGQGGFVLIRQIG